MNRIITYFKKFSSGNIFYINVTPRLRINLFIIPIIYSAYKFNYINLIVLSYITALLHEFSHIFMMKLLKVPVKRIDVQPFGVAAFIEEASIYNSSKEIIISLSGPLFNFIVYFVIKYINIPYREFLISINLAMGIFNLIPSLPLDGGRVLKSILSINFGVIRSYNFMIKLSRVILIFLLFFGAVIIIFIPFNFSLILIGVFLFCNICSEEKCLSKIILKDILNHKTIHDNKLLKTKVISVSDSSPPRHILKLLSFDYYLEVLVLSEYGKILFTTTETEIINHLINNGIRSKYKDIKKHL